MSEHYLLQNLKLVELSQVNEEQRGILESAKKQVGFIPNMYSAMVNVPAVLSTYLYGYQQVRKHSDLSSAEQEVVFMAISQQNSCDYCFAAHCTLAANISEVPRDVLNAIRSGGMIPDARFAALYAMAVELNNSRGRPEKEIVQAFLNAGFTEKHMLSIVLALSVKILSNYSNHLFDTEIDEMFVPFK